MAKSELRHLVKSDLTEFWTEERCFITELMNNETLPDTSLARCRVKPGVTTQLHTLNVREIYIVERGKGLLTDNNQSSPVEVGPGDCVEIPKDHPQQIENIGEEDLVFLCLCTPRFEAPGYKSLEHS